MASRNSGQNCGSFQREIGHHPIEIVEGAADHEIGGALRRRQAGVDRQAVFVDEVGDDGIAVTDVVSVIVDIRQLAARRRFRVEDMRVLERQPDELKEGEDLEPERIVVGDPE
jgi:hypothetical protein